METYSRPDAFAVLIQPPPISVLCRALHKTEIGGGWLRKAKASGREYVSITFADPQIGQRKIYANLAPVKGKKGRHVILWNPSL